MLVIGLDFETKSRVDLKKVGTDNYASDPSTDILCCSFINKTTGDEWLWYAGEEVPESLHKTLEFADEIEAQNARFDQLIYEFIAVDDYGFPALKKEKWVCTAAQCRVNALPANLDGATRAANAKHKKDHTGGALIRKLSIPQKDGTFNTDPKLHKQMGDYCMQDSRAMVSLTQALRPLSEQDKIDWQINERINDRGVKIDRELAELAEKYAAQEKKELGKKLSILTNGEITAVTQTARLLPIIREYCRGRPIELYNCIKKPLAKGETEQKHTLDKTARAALLDNENFTGQWREVVELIHQGGKSSVSKFTAMLQRADPDTDRVHGAFIFAGAGQTQRYSAKGLQPHNMIRDCLSAHQTEEYKRLMRKGAKLSKVMDTLAKLLRPCIIPDKGCKFVVGDWSAIEARVLPWLADTPKSKLVLDVFREDRDIYVETAQSMNMDDRQIGKVAVLSLGFGGAVGAFQAMAKNYGVIIGDGEAQIIVNRWRKANPWARDFWSLLEHATVKALRKPTEVFTAGRIKYTYLPHILGGTLFCILPNDTVIQYPYARLENGSVTCMKASVIPKADSQDEWPRMRLWGGFLAENVTQATSSCLLRELLHDMVVDGLPVVMHVHDEVVLEVPADEIEEILATTQEYMEMVPDWAAGLPLKAVPEVFERYGK